MKTKVLILIALMIFFAGCPEVIPDNGGNNGTGEDTVLSPPTNLKVTSKVSSLELTWDPINSDTLKGYNIYRSLNKGKDYGKINSFPVKTESFIDEELTGGITYYYVITSVTKTDKESNTSLEAFGIPIILNPGNGEEKPFVELCNKEGTQLKIDQCLNEYAVEFNDVGACREMKELNIDKCVKDIAVNLKSYATCKEIKITNVSLRNECFYEIAISEQDASGCNQIINDPEKSNACNSIVAAAENSIEACKDVSVTRDKDICFKALAVNLNDYVICSYMSTSKTSTGFNKDECLNTILQSIKEEALCTFFLEESQKNNCFAEVGIELVNPLICQNLTDEEITNYCIKDIAVAEQDSDYCLQITDNGIFQECVIAVSEVNPYKDACELIEDLSIKNNCYYNTAQSTKKEVYCSYVIENEIRDTCYSELAIDLNKSELCDKIRYLNPNLKNSCYSTIAVNNLDSTLCQKVTGSETYVNCFTNISISLTDFTVCNSATKRFPTFDFITQDYCFYNYAENKKDEFACEQIMSTTLRADCDVNALAP